MDMTTIITLTGLFIVAIYACKAFAPPNEEEILVEKMIENLILRKPSNATKPQNPSRILYFDTEDGSVGIGYFDGIYSSDGAWCFRAWNKQNKMTFSSKALTSKSKNMINKAYRGFFDKLENDQKTNARNELLKLVSKIAS